MKTLHLYLTRQVLGTLLMTVMVFTFVMMIGSVTKEILGLLVGGQATLGLVARALVLLLPYVLVFALPMGLLTATLLVFGRFSADNELTAAKASGVSLVSLITPVLILSVLCSAAAAYINLDLAPRCRMAYKRLIAQGGLAQSANLIPERTYITDLDTNCIIYVGKVSGTNLEDVLIYEWRDNKVESYNRADNGVIQINTLRTQDGPHRGVEQYLQRIHPGRQFHAAAPAAGNR
ncbi:MAG: LptF/LptG family permease [Verrucomicrobia bacterium]|nr:LptF/LptG family permease [Verrucomicrobiota bacterium]